MVHRCLIWVGLLNAFQPWQLEQHHLILGKLVIREEALGSDLDHSCKSCIVKDRVSSAIKIYLQLMGGSQG